MGILLVSFMPRARFCQFLFFNLVFMCISAAYCLLMVRCVVSARPPKRVPVQVGSSGGSETPEYSSAASAVAATFLFFGVYVLNAIKGSTGTIHMILGVVMASIFLLVTSVYATTFPDMQAGMVYVGRLLKGYLTGYGIAFCVHFLVFPITCRSIYSKQMTGLLGLIKKNISNTGLHIGEVAHAHDQDWTSPEAQSNAAAMKENTAAVAKLLGKAKIELSYAKREAAFGKLRPEHYEKLFGLVQQIVLPIIGLSTFMNIMQSVSKRRIKRDQRMNSVGLLTCVRQLEGNEWDEIVTISSPHYMRLKDYLMDGLAHIAICLELQRRPKGTHTDSEAMRPGSPNYMKTLEIELYRYQDSRAAAVRDWCAQKEVDLPSDFAETTFATSLSACFSPLDVRKEQNHHQLYLLLYIQYLVLSTGTAILELGKFADSLVADGAMSKRRFIVPAWRLLAEIVDPSKYFATIFSHHFRTNSMGTNIDRQVDPEHSPPSTTYEPFTEHIRRSYGFVGSPASMFGLRAAFATMSLAMLAYLRETQSFFIQQRGFWSTVMIAISMEQTSGRGAFGCVQRIVATLIGTVASIAIWYASDQKAAAVIPLCFLFFMGGLHYVLKNPHMILSGFICMVTIILIDGYKLQEDMIGLKAALKNGQTYHPLYLLAPYRLASVCAGIGAAAFWTFFPFPVTQYSIIRKDVGHTLYVLAGYYASVHATVNARLRSPSNPSQKAVGGYTPHGLTQTPPPGGLTACIQSLSKLDEALTFLKWEPTFGGPFPEAKYRDLIAHMRRVFNFTTLIGYSSRAFTSEQPLQPIANDIDASKAENEWLTAFRAFTANQHLTSPHITSTLCLVGASLSHAQPLPPHIPAPARARSATVSPVRSNAESSTSTAADTTVQGESVLSVKHLDSPCYEAFAVMEVASALVKEEVEAVEGIVKGLVGEVDFGFAVDSERGLERE